MGLRLLETIGEPVAPTRRHCRSARPLVPPEAQKKLRRPAGPLTSSPSTSSAGAHKVISKSHARISWSQGQYFIEALHKNGLICDGVKVGLAGEGEPPQKLPLSAKSRIKIGPLHLFWLPSLARG